MFGAILVQEGDVCIFELEMKKVHAQSRAVPMHLARAHNENMLMQGLLHLHLHARDIRSELTQLYELRTLKYSDRSDHCRI